MEKTEESVKLYGEVEGRVREHQVRLESLELLEERVAKLEVQNLKLKKHLNFVIGGVNGMIQLMNNSTSALMAAIDDQPKLTVQHVYMYQTQPPTEEGWQEMTDAIKAAEEYETQPEQQLFNVVNGLTTVE